MAGVTAPQDYIDSMEGATLSGRQCAGAILKAAPALQKAAAAALA
jgi:zeta-carotene desaturase